MSTFLRACIDRINCRTTWLISTIFLLVACFTISALYDLHSPDLNKYGDNVWFQGDITRIYDNMTNRYAHGHYRANVHPLYSLLTYPPTFLLKKLLSSDALAIKFVTLMIASCWLVSLYALLRVMGCLKLDATIFAILGASSSAAMFWLYVPETYALASVSMMLAIGLSIVASKKRLPDWIFATISAFSISVTITNWMAGLLSSFSSLTLKRALKVSCIAIFSVAILWGLQKLIFPASEFFVGSSEESKYMFAPSIERFLQVSNAFFLHAMIAPELRISALNQFAWPLLSFQSSPVGSTGTLGWIATCIWLAVLSLGVWALVKVRMPVAFKVTLAMTLLGQLVLHFIYGEETFLYSLNFTPLLVTLAAVATLSTYRKAAITLGLILIPVLIFNNLTQLKLASAMASPAYSNSSQGLPPP